MTEQINYNFGGIANDSSALHGAVGRTAGLLEEGNGSLARLQAGWVGQGSDSYQSVQARWDANALELNQALQNLAQAIGTAGDDMAATELGVTNTFGG